MSLWQRGATIALGNTRLLWLFSRTLRISARQARAHMHILGKTGSGKSYFLAGLFLAFYEARMPVTLIDPHGDLAELVLSHLAASGVFRDGKAFERLVYLDLPAAAASGRYLPFNYLVQPYRRAWPELATGAPTFENILKHSVIVLRQNGLPLTELANLLTDKDMRERLLLRVTDPQVVRFFHARMDQWGREASLMKESTLNRADLLTLSPVLRYSLGSTENRLSFRELIDSGRSLIVNLALPHHDARRLFGCLLTVGMESAALSRADNRTARVPHHLMIDEFSQFMAQSEQSLTRMLSETRKYGLFCVMAHQNWTQASDRLKGALQNVGIEMILKSGRMDAEYSARVLGSVDPMEVKHLVEDERAEERSHPAYMSLPEQWEKQVQAIQRLKVGEAFVRLADDSIHKVRTRTLPRIAEQALEHVRERYLQAYFKPPSGPLQVVRVPAVMPAITRRPGMRRVS
jgi:hypothetical protein